MQRNVRVRAAGTRPTCAAWSVPTTGSETMGEHRPARFDLPVDPAGYSGTPEGRDSARVEHELDPRDMVDAYAELVDGGEILIVACCDCGADVHIVADEVCPLDLYGLRCAACLDREWEEAPARYRTYAAGLSRRLK